MPVEDADDINRMTGSISGVFLNPMEISPEAQENATGMLTSFMGVIDQLESADDAVDALSNMLDVSSKLLQSTSSMADVVDPNNTDAKALKSMASNNTKVSCLYCCCC